MDWNAPILVEGSVDDNVSFVEKIVHATLTGKSTDPEFHELVKLYQIHRHSRTFRNYKFHFLM